MSAAALVLFACGLVLAAVGLLRSYTLARRAIAPFAQQGDPTRAAIEALRPLPFRPKFRTAVLRALVSVGWLMLSFYGLYFVVHAVSLLA